MEFHNEGGKTALYALVASLRPKSAKPLVRFEGLPGEFSQHDFGQIEVEFVDGSGRRIHFFASRLKYSRLIRVSLVPDEAVESLVRTLAEHLASGGGLPLRCVFDRPKTIALQWKKKRGGDGEIFTLTTQADNNNSICFGDMIWGSYLRRKDRANSFANRESLSLLMITHVLRHNEVSESGFTTTPWALTPTAGLVRMATPTCSDTK